MWDMWVAGDIESPYSELMEYESEVNNGGHFQYFFNAANCGDLSAEVNEILPVLPEPLRGNLKRGYDAFSAQEDICDDVLYKNEKLLMDVLKGYADSLNL